MPPSRKQLERTLKELQCLEAKDNLACEFDTDYIGPSSFTRKEMEMLRGAERVARLELGDRQLPGDAVEGPRISVQERAQRDEQRKHLTQWKILYEN